MKQAGWMPAGWKPRRAAKGVRAPEREAIWIGAGTADGPTNRQNAAANNGEGL